MKMNSKAMDPASSSSILEPGHVVYWNKRNKQWTELKKGMKTKGKTLGIVQDVIYEWKQGERVAVGVSVYSVDRPGWIVIQ